MSYELLKVTTTIMQILSQWKRNKPEGATGTTTSDSCMYLFCT